MDRRNKGRGNKEGWMERYKRNEFLTANNSKLQDQYVKNKMLIEQNQNIMEKNNQLELEKETLIEDGNNKVSAMGEDMGNLIHKNKILRRKYKKKKPSNSILGATTGFGYKKSRNFSGHKLTSIRITALIYSSFV